MIVCLNQCNKNRRSQNVSGNKSVHETRMVKARRVIFKDRIAMTRTGVEWDGHYREPHKGHLNLAHLSVNPRAGLDQQQPRNPSCAE